MFRVNPEWGIYIDAIEGEVQLWKKNETKESKWCGVKLESEKYSTRGLRNKLMGIWQRKYRTHLSPKNFYWVTIPSRKIDEESEQYIPKREPQKYFKDDNKGEYKRPPALYGNRIAINEYEPII